MKKSILFALFLVVFFAPAIHAGEYERNPDRFTSLGISLGVIGLTGVSKHREGAFSGDQNSNYGQFDITLDTRIPVSDSLTLNGALGFVSTASELDQTAFLPGAENDLAGVSLRIGARYYFN